jgi:hypothetical protein
VASGPLEKKAIPHVVLLVGGAVASRTVHIPVARPAGNRPTQIGVRAKASRIRIEQWAEPITSSSRHNWVAAHTAPDDLQIASTTNSGCPVRHGACIGFDHQLAAEHDLGNSCCGAGRVVVAVDALALAI